MDQRLITKPDEISTLLKKSLIKQSLVEESIIENLLKERDQAIDAAKKEIQGTCFMVDYYDKKLKIFDTYTGQILHSIDLPGKPTDFNPDDFDIWGTSSAILDLEELYKEGDIPYYVEGDYGLVIRDTNCYLNNPEIDRQYLLGLTNQYIFGGIPKKAKTNLPYDMYFSDDYSLLCLSNRDEGKVYLFDVKNSDFTGEISVRSPGSNKAINMAISTSKSKIYITDNLTPMLSIYDLFHKTLTKKNLSMGVLGNICLAPDDKSIYLVIIKPEQNLKNLDIENYSEIKSFPPKGELFSIGDAPCDLLVLSPDKKYILSMTYINDPHPKTPVISVIDIEKNKVIKRFSIKDEQKPVNLCFKDNNPIGSVNKTLEELLIENGLFSINKLRDLKNAALYGNDNVDEKEENIIKIESEALEFDVKPEESSTQHSGIVPKKVKHVIIPASANKHIMEILLGSFWQKHEIDLSENPEEQKKLNEVAENVRKKLEYYDLEIVNIKGFYEKKLPLEGIISREYILEMVDEEESRDRQTIKTAPSNCPNCGAPLMGAWECSACGFFLEKPEDALRRKLASADQLANLQKGYFFVLDSSNGELFEVDQYKVPVWKISKDDLDLQSITAAVRLENMNTLILDGEAGNILEITPKGRTSWQFTPAEATQNLNKPSGFTLVNTDHLLIADTQNNRVMEVDLDGNIIWQYGKYGTPGVEENYLNNPMYIQKTYDETFLITDTGNNRILELSRNIDPTSAKYKMKIDWQYGNSLNVQGGGKGSGNNELNNPVMAFKDLVGNILILDAGNKRVIEVNQERKILWNYLTETGEEVSRISNPTRVTRLKNRDILIVGDGKYVQIIPTTKNPVAWVSNPEDLSSRTNFKIVKENITKTKVKHGSSSRYMRKIGDSGIEKDKELTTIIEEKRTTAANSTVRHEGEKPVVFLTPGETVLPMPIIIIDKIDNKILLTNREGNIIWSYGEGEGEKLNRVNTAEITPERTLLISDARSLIEVDMKSKKRIWEYECQARNAHRLKTGITLISDEKNFRVIEINKNKEVLWEHYHEDGEAIPSYASRLANGNFLIAYSVHIVVEVNSDHKVIWSFGEYNKSGYDDKHLCFPEYASRLKNGNTLICDTKNSRVIEVSSQGEIVWTYKGSGNQRLISPNFSGHLKDDHIYIVHSGNRQIIEIDYSGKVLWKLSLQLKK